ACRIVGFTGEARASNGSFNDRFRDSRRVGYYAGDFAEETQSLVSIKAWRTIPVFAVDSPVPAFGATEYWQQPGFRHVGEHDRTYIGWISESGVVQVQYYDHDDEQFSAITDVVALRTLDSDVQLQAVDDHNAPTIVVAADGSVCVFACVHDRPGLFKLYRSTSPEDILAFDAPVDLIDTGLTADVYNYPQPHIFPDGSIRVFYRYQSFTSGVWKTKTSTDNGLTWGPATTVLDFSGESKGAYGMTRQDPNNPRRIVMASHAAQVASPTREGIWYAESLDGGETWQQSDGTALTLPLTTANQERIFDSGNDRVRITGMAAMPVGARVVAGYDEEPDHVTIAVQHDQTSAWTNAVVAASRLHWNGNGQSWYTPGGDVHPKNHDEIALSIPIGDVLEVQKYATSDGGETWRLIEQVTASSLEDQWRPMYVVNPNDELDLVWCSGFYTGSELGNDWVGYDTVRIITPKNQQHRRLDETAERIRLALIDASLRQPASVIVTQPLTPSADLVTIRQGDDYSGSRAFQIDIDSVLDLTGKNLVMACQSGAEEFSLRFPIEGLAGEHFVTFDAEGSVTQELTPLEYEVLYRIEHSSGVEETIQVGRFNVEYFKTPLPIANT
ncbi:MAG: BNR-4 repeat-containing protein, partial [Planctomycetota bacterium]